MLPLTWLPRFEPGCRANLSPGGETWPWPPPLLLGIFLGGKLGLEMYQNHPPRSSGFGSTHLGRF